MKGESQHSIEGTKKPSGGGSMAGEPQRCLERGATGAGRGSSNRPAPGYPKATKNEGGGNMKRGKAGKLGGYKGNK